MDWTYLVSTVVARLVVLQLHVVDAGRRSGNPRTHGTSGTCGIGAVMQRDWTVSGSSPAILVLGLFLLLFGYTPANTHAVRCSTVLRSTARTV